MTPQLFVQLFGVKVARVAGQLFAATRIQKITDLSHNFNRLPCNFLRQLVLRKLHSCPVSAPLGAHGTATTGSDSGNLGHQEQNNSSNNWRSRAAKRLVCLWSRAGLHRHGKPTGSPAPVILGDRRKWEGET